MASERLGLRPLARLRFVAELASSGFAVELPVDHSAGAIDPSIPGAALATQSPEVGNSSATKALPGEHSDFDFRLIQPASVGGCVVNSESVPDLAANLRAVTICQ